MIQTGLPPALLPNTLLATLPDWGFALMLVLCRVGTACMLLPGFGEAELPPMIRLAIALTITALVLPALQPAMPALPSEPIHLAVMLLHEILCGLWFGFIVRVLLLAMPMAGQLIAGVIGLANVIQPDAMLGASSTALSRLLGLAAPLVIFTSGLAFVPISAIIGFYALVPAGTLPGLDDAAQTLLGAISGSLALALRLSAPFILAGLVFHTGLALIARLVPQLQTYFAAAPGQILGGLALLAVLLPLLLEHFQTAASATLAALPGL